MPDADTTVTTYIDDMWNEADPKRHRRCRRAAASHYRLPSSAASIRVMPQWDAEITVDEQLARELIVTRFPDLDASELRRLGEGWDNVVWVTRDGVAFRFPRREVAVAGVEREIALLPALRPRLPLPVPDAAFASGPSNDFRWPWFGSHLIEGRELAATALDDHERIALATQLGSFLRTLHGLPLHPAEEAELPLDPFGRTDMAVRVPKTREALAAAELLWTPPRAAAEQLGCLLDEAEGLPPPATVTLVHGDLHARHVLVEPGGTLAGVIDWGDICRADPTADLSPVWSALPAAGREAFFAAYGQVGQASLLRARVLALFLCATLGVYARSTGQAALEREMLDGLRRTLVS